MFVASLISAYVLAYFTVVTNSYFQNSFLLDAIMTGILAWLGFTALRMFTHDIFEGRCNKLTILNTTHELVTFLVMATIIGLLPL